MLRGEGAWWRGWAHQESPNEDDRRQLYQTVNGLKRKHCQAVAASVPALRVGQGYPAAWAASPPEGDGGEGRGGLVTVGHGGW